MIATSFTNTSGLTVRVGITPDGFVDVHAADHTVDVPPGRTYTLDVQRGELHDDEGVRPCQP